MYANPARAFLIYWNEEDSVSVTRIDDMLEQRCEPAVGDTVKIRFGRQVCKGTVADKGTTQAIRAKKEQFMKGEYTPFSRKRPKSPQQGPSTKRRKEDKENNTLAQGRGLNMTSRGRGVNRRGRGAGRARGGGYGKKTSGMYIHSLSSMYCTSWID